jgi:hypothetical protein
MESISLQQLKIVEDMEPKIIIQHHLFRSAGFLFQQIIWQFQLFILSLQLHPLSAAGMSFE